MSLKYTYSLYGSHLVRFCKLLCNNSTHFVRHSRHKALVNQYLLTQGKGIEHFKRPTENDRNDYTVLAEEHRFLWNEDDDVDSWEQRLAKSYYDRLFKEYAISDLSRYKENKVALRWRIQKEVIDGKGQFVCGNKHCSEREELQSWEVNFSYVEQGEKKNALVKLRLCEECSAKLNYHHKRKLWKKTGGDSKAGSAKSHKKQKHKHGHKRKQKRRRSGSSKDKNKHSRRDASPRTSESEESSSREGDSEEDRAAASQSNASAIWSKPAEVFLEKSKDEEYDDYFKDMLL